MNIQNIEMLNLGITAVSEYIEKHYQEMDEEKYFLLDSLKKLMIEQRNKLREN